MRRIISALKYWFYYLEHRKLIWLCMTHSLIFRRERPVCRSLFVRRERPSLEEASACSYYITINYCLWHHVRTNGCPPCQRGDGIGIVSKWKLEGGFPNRVTDGTNLRNIRIIDGLLLLAKPKQRLGIPPPTSSVPLPLTREAIAECEHLALNNNLVVYFSPHPPLTRSPFPPWEGYRWVRTWYHKQ